MIVNNFIQNYFSLQTKSKKKKNEEIISHIEAPETKNLNNYTKDIFENSFISKNPSNKTPTSKISECKDAIEKTNLEISLTSQDNTEPHQIDSKSLSIMNKEICSEKEQNCINIENCKLSVNTEINFSISKSDYQNLNKDLNNFKPFLKPCKELERLKLSDKEYLEQESKVEEVLSIMPSAPQINCSQIASIQNSPLYASQNSLVRQRCSELTLESPIKSLVDVKEKMITDMSAIKPYSEVQLLALYNNVFLDEKEQIITDFLEHEKNIMQNKFHEILLNYLRARTNLVGTEKQIKMTMEQYKKHKEEIWTFEEHTLNEEGTCEDDQLISVTCTHETASYQPIIAKHIGKQLKQVRESIFESHSLHIYTAEISKLQVENYLQHVIQSCPKFTSLPKCCPVDCLFYEHEKSFLVNIAHLKNCISILMLFIRRNVQDLVFIRDIKSWLSDAIAVLLRVATHKDHLFILNHLMRCSAGVGDWGAQFIQVNL